MFYLYLLMAVLGLIVGSFLNAVIYRLGTQESVIYQNKKEKTWKTFLTARSYCPHCQHQLRWYDLIPLLSFIFLKAKCRYCQMPISFQYPLVEIITGLLFILTFRYLVVFNLWYLHPLVAFILLFLYLIVVSCLIIIAVYDIKHLLIPPTPLMISIFLVLVINIIMDIKILEGMIFSFQSATAIGLMAALMLGGFFYLIFVVSKGKWIGFGDVNLAILLGFLTGIKQDVFYIILVLFLASFIGSITGIGLIISQKKSFKTAIPFAPFLILAVFIVLFWGSGIIHYIR